MGVEIKVENLTKRFGSALIWEDVSLTIPAGEISVMLGPSGTGKSVFLKHLVGLLRPTNGHVWIEGKDIPNLPEKDLYEIRKLFGVLFQDGALFGSMNLYDNVAFPLREHTKKSESEIRKIVTEKMDLVGLADALDKLPGEISGGMKKRAGLARALVLDPEIVLFDEPDSGLDPVRTAYLNQLIVDLNAETQATFLIVTHDIMTARTLPDNIGLLYQKHLAMFGPREMLLSSPEPVVLQFLNARRHGPIGMSEEKDAAELEAEEGSGAEAPELPAIPRQLMPSGGRARASMRPPGQWLRANGVEPPAGSYLGEGDDEVMRALGLEPGSSVETADAQAPDSIEIVGPDEAYHGEGEPDLVIGTGDPKTDLGGGHEKPAGYYDEGGEGYYGPGGKGSKSHLGDQDGEDADDHDAHGSEAEHDDRVTAGRSRDDDRDGGRRRGARRVASGRSAARDDEPGRSSADGEDGRPRRRRRAALPAVSETDGRTGRAAVGRRRRASLPSAEDLRGADAPREDDAARGGDGDGGHRVRRIRVGGRR